MPHFDPQGAVAVALLAIPNTVGVFLLYNYALRVLTALEMSALTSLSPLVTALFAWVFLGEGLAPVQLVGLLAVVGGVAMVQLTDRATSLGTGDVARSTDHQARA
jgi:drug/metabolite transporter (DMT)-like permease